MRHVATLGVPPPGDPHDRIQSRRFLRALLLRWLGVSVAAWALVGLVTELSVTWLVVGGVILIVLAADVVWLTHSLRQKRNGAAGG